MPSSLLYNNFSGGIIGPKLRRNVSSELYQNSAAEMENAVPMTTGGFRLRPGFRRVMDASGYIRMLPFVLASDDYHVLLIGVEKTVLVDFTDFRTGKLHDTGYDTPWSGKAAVEEVVYTQNNDRLVMTQIDRPPQIFAKEALGYSLGPIVLDAVTSETTQDEDGTETYVQWDYDGFCTTPGKYPALCAFAMQRLWLMSTKTDPYRMWASRPAEYDNFQTKDSYETVDEETTVDDYLEAVTGDDKTIGYYLDEACEQPVTGDDAEKRANYKLETTKSVSDRGIVLYQYVLYRKTDSAGDGSEESTEIVWEFVSSRTESEKYTETKTKWERETTDQCAMELTPASDRNDPIRWVSQCSNYIYYGTMSNISKMPIDISPLNTTTNVTGAYGCDSRQPARGNGSVYYSSCANRQVWCLTETYYGPQFVNASLYCDHLFRCGIRRMAWQSAPEPRLHVVLQDGTMAVLVANSSGSMSAWCHWSTKVGKVRDIAVLDTENGQDVYLLVEESDTSSGIYVLDETLFDDGDDVAIEGRVVLNPVDGGATVSRYKYAGVFHVDSMGTKFTVGQNGVAQASPYSGYDYDLTRVSAPAVPGHTYRIEIDNVPHEDWTVLCVYTEAEVS